MESINHQQVGHISAASSHPNMAACLAPIMDYRLSGRAGGKTEGISAPEGGGGSSKFSSKCHITIIGLMEHKDTISAHFQTCRVPYYDVIKSKPFLGYNTESYSSDLSISKATQNARGQYTTHTLSEEEIIHSMDSIWGEQESAVNEMKLQVPDLSVLTQCLLPTLYQHQQIGIAWMLDRENIKSNELPPFYSSIQGSSSYHHSLTKHNYTDRPKNIRGGILADTMGLGKSLCVIGLILTNPPPGKVYTAPVCVLVASESSTDQEVAMDTDALITSRAKRPHTVVIDDDETDDGLGAEVSVVKPAATVAEMKFQLKSLGLKSSGSKQELSDRLSQYKTEGALGPQKKSSSFSNTSTLQTIRPYTTLIVCPLSVLSAWQDQLNTHLREGVLTVVTYYGSDRRSLYDEQTLSQADVVLTTYDVLTSEINSDAEFHASDLTMIGKAQSFSSSSSSSQPAAKKQRSKANSYDSPLQNIQWWRIVLDEAHTVRNMNTKKARAVMALQSNCRWIVSGTLIVNTAADLESLISFLELEPFFKDSSLFKRYFVRPIKAGNVEALAKVRTLMKTISLRREKNNVGDLYLPPKIEQNVLVTLSKSERAAYDAIANAVSDYQQYLTDSSSSSTSATDAAMQNVQSLLALITRLRQACLDLSLVPVHALVKLLATTGVDARSKSADGSVLERLSEKEKSDLADKLKELFSAAGALTVTATDDTRAEDNNNEECAVCLDPLVPETSIIFRICKHALCQVCVDGVFKNGFIDRSGQKCVKCPLCRQIVVRSDCVNIGELKKMIEPDTIKDEKMETEEADIKANPQVLDTKEKVHSSKTMAVLQALGKAYAAGEQTVIFSSFVSYLDILENAISESGYRLCRIDGSTSQQKRARQIQQFSSDKNIAVILCSVKACGVGITLTSANNIFLTDLWWAPSVDLQAIDRVHRIGQTKPVNVLRYVNTSVII